MNQRIKELAKQAQTECGWSEDKFAELIIRECAGIAKQHVMNISTYADAEFVEEQIVEHFGVEE